LKKEEEVSEEEEGVGVFRSGSFQEWEFSGVFRRRGIFRRRNLKKEEFGDEEGEEGEGEEGGGGGEEVRRCRSLKKEEFEGGRV
jgi:hypothetical protein